MATTARASSIPRSLGGGLRLTFLVVGALLLSAGFITFVLAERTEEYFAWTIEPPLTAAYIGAGYFASVALVVLAAGARDWAHARAAIPSALVFSGLVLLATGVHFERFHDDRPITWAWVAIYITVPILLVVFGWRESRAARQDPPRAAPLPRWASVVLAANAAVALPLGTALFAAPGTFDAAWAWPLTPLTGRVIGAFLVALGLVAAHSALERDWQRIRPVAAMFALYGAFELANVARYSGTFDWGDARAWLHVAFFTALLGFGVEGVRRGAARAA